MEPAPLERTAAESVRQGFLLTVWIACLALLLILLPNRIWNQGGGVMVLSLGAIAAWRYGWWALHLVRALIYAHIVFPRHRKRADALWRSGWRPRRMHFMVTTFRERPEITRAVLESIFRECRDTGVPARVFVGTGDRSDELVIEGCCARAVNTPAEVFLVRQNIPGKRVAMALALRAMCRHGVEPDDIVVFMDGDSIILPGALAKTAPLFGNNPKLGGVTTDECGIVNGPGWIADWTEMRFAQRRIAMQSHALSRKVLTLTGRFSIFRGRVVADPEFIRTLEADYLDHWLWGSFRFLSGDDKSTWFSLLRTGREMLYVPDACALTVENIAERPLERVKANLMRWSGNMLRNGYRALELGPRRVGFFIWWCVLDQRLSIWTGLSGPAFALAASLIFGLKVWIAYFIWVAVTRTLLSFVLYLYAGRIYISFPFLLYGNQIAGSAIKVYLLFRVNKQRWLNRGDQKQRSAASRLRPLQHGMAAFLTLVYLAVFFFAACLKTGVVSLSALTEVWSRLWWPGFGPG
jgi:glycosyltransferase Alg8